MTPKILEKLRFMVGPSHVRTDADSLLTWGCDWTKNYTPCPSAIVFPASTEEVQSIVHLANTEKIALVPSGGRTGLSAGAVAAHGEVVISFDRMNKVLDFFPDDRMVQVQAGVVTQQLQQYADEHGLYYPVDFASAGSSQIGGNIGTNAGGIKVIRYGMTRAWVMGLTVVTGKGDVLNLNNGMAKNATGYDLRHLFIGAEGTLGFITEAQIKLERKPRDSRVLVLGIPDFRSIMQVLAAFRAVLDLTAFEFFSELAVVKVIASGDVARPFAEIMPFYVLLEFEAASPAIEEQAMQVFEACMDAGWVLNGVMSQSEAQARSLWRLREDISETISKFTPYKNDVSVLISHIPAFIADIDAIVQAKYPDFEIIWFGHIGDGNLHLNILKPADSSREAFFAKCHAVNQSVFETVQKYGGSISAEHGVGMTKKPYLAFTRPPEEIAYLQAIKRIFDPNNIINPGKIFDLD